MYRIYIFYHSYAKQYPMCALCVIYRMIFFCSRHICWQQAHWQHPIPATFNRHIKLRRTAKNISIRRHRYRCSCNHRIFYSIWWYGAIWFVFYLQKPKNWLIPPADPIKMGEKKIDALFWFAINFWAASSTTTNGIIIAKFDFELMRSEIEFARIVYSIPFKPNFLRSFFSLLLSSGCACVCEMRKN